MWRWLLVVFLALILFNGLMPWLRKIFGRDWYLPITTTLVLSLLAAGVSRLI